MRIKEENQSDDVGKVTLSEQEIDFAANESYDREWNLDSDFERIAVLIETISGDVQCEFQGPPGGFSKIKGVLVFAGKLGANASKVALRLRSVVASKIRVTVAFLKKESSAVFQRMPCKLCKSVCRLGMNAALASFGLPLVSLDLPIPDNWVDPEQVLIEIREVFGSAGKFLPDGLHEFFAGISPVVWSSLQGALGAFDILTDGVDRVLESACRTVGCCA